MGKYVLVKIGFAEVTTVERKRLHSSVKREAGFPPPLGYPPEFSRCFPSGNDSFLICFKSIY